MARRKSKMARLNWHSPARGTVKRSRPLATRRQPEKTHLELRIWLRLFGIATRLERLFAARLRREFNTTMSRFDLLAQLQRSQGGLNMSELSANVMVTNGAVTGMVAKLVAEGWARRHSHPKDRRIMLVKLTPLGRRNFHKMARRHEDWVIELLRGLPAGLKRGLHEHLTALKRGLEGTQHYYSSGPAIDQADSPLFVQD